MDEGGIRYQLGSLVPRKFMQRARKDREVWLIAASCGQLGHVDAV